MNRIKYYIHLPLSLHLRRLLGTAAICFYIIHGTYWVLHGVPANLLWACHIGSLAVGFGLIFKKPMLISTGVLWLCLGNVIWFLYLAGGGNFEPTSPLTHIGGLIIGIIGLFDSRMPQKSWIWSLVFLAAIQQLSRWVTPEIHNINLAFRIHDGWEAIFSSYKVYMAMLLLITGLLFFSLEKFFIRITKPSFQGR